MKAKLNLFVILILFVFIKEQYCVFPSYQILPGGNFVQTEPVIFVSPVNNMIMFCSAYTINSPIKSEGMYVTTNGGVNWFGTDSINASPTVNQGGDPGIAIDKNGVFLLYHVGNIQQGVFTHYSTNLGQTWSNQFIISQGILPEDKGTLTTDNSSFSPYYGRSYAAWVNFQSPYPVLFSYTTNGGTSWSSYSQINPSPPQRCSGGDIKTGPDGFVYVSWSGVQPNFPNTENYAGFAYSSNGGSSWTFTQNIFNMNGIGGLLTQKSSILVNGLPRMAVDLTTGPRSGWIYLVTTEKDTPPAGSDPDIVFHRSTNKGLTWSQGIRVNQDAPNNGRIQYFPAICVDSTGGIDVLYFDDRNTFANPSDSTDVYLSRSTNGGTTWSDILVSDKRYKPGPIFSSGFQGDFISITSARNKLFPVWMASYTGSYRVWTTIIDISAIGIKQISSIVPRDFELKQNYPNPFNPSTNIEFSVPQKSKIRIAIYNSLGRFVEELVNSEMAPGAYNITFDAMKYASGVYFYQLQTDGIRIARKMIIVK